MDWRSFDFMGKGVVHLFESGLQLEGRMPNLYIPFIPSAIYAFLTDSTRMIPYRFIKKVRPGYQNIILTAAFSIVLIGVFAFLKKQIYDLSILALFRASPDGWQGKTASNGWFSMDTWLVPIVVTLPISIYTHLRLAECKLILQTSSKAKIYIRMKFLSKREESEFIAALNRNVSITREIARSHG